MLRLFLYLLTGIQKYAPRIEGNLWFQTRPPVFIQIQGEISLVTILKKDSVAKYLLYNEAADCSSLDTVRVTEKNLLVPPTEHTLSPTFLLDSELNYRGKITKYQSLCDFQSKILCWTSNGRSTQPANAVGSSAARTIMLNQQGHFSLTIAAGLASQ